MADLIVETGDIALVMLYMTLGRAAIEFPTTTAAHPSTWVHVGLTHAGPLIADHAHVFPIKVRWDVWENVVVQVWKDPSYKVKVLDTVDVSLRIHQNVVLIDLRAYDTLLEKIEAAVLGGYRAAGYLPYDDVPPGFVPTPPAPGEPILDPGEQPGEFKRFDC